MGVAENDVRIPVLEDQKNGEGSIEEEGWVRAAVLGATDGLMVVASLMMIIGAIKESVEALILAGFVGVVTGACRIAIKEFVKVQYEHGILDLEMNDDEMKKAARGPKSVAGHAAFMLGAVTPLVGAGLIEDSNGGGKVMRVGVVVGGVSLGQMVFGWIGGVVERTPMVVSCFRIVVGGWMAMALTKLITFNGL